MNSCDEYQNAFTDALVEGTALGDELAGHLRTCASCAEEYRIGQEIWRMLPELEEDSRALPPPVPIRNRWASGNRLAMSLAAVLLFGAGIATGMLVFGRGPTPGGQVDRLEQKVDSLNELVVLSLLEQSSASARLEAISRIAAIDDPSRALATALLRAAVADPNPNVRLAAVEASRPLMSRPGAYRELAERLTLESSPLVQIALVDVLLEQPSARPAEIEHLMERDGVEDEVRAFVRQRVGERT